MNSFPALVPPVRHLVWGLPAVINLCAGGAGSVLYALTFLLPPHGSALLGLSQVNFIRLSCILMVAAGFVSVGIESRKPMNARFLLHHLRRSWMSREVFAGSLFILLATLDIVSPHQMLQLGALAMAVFLLICQVMMLYDAKGMDLWSTRLVAVHALSSNLYLACGIALVFRFFGVVFHLESLVAVALASLAFNHIAWWTLLRSRKTSGLRVSLKPLITPMKLTIGIGIGQILPALMLIFALAVKLLLEVNTMLPALFLISGGMIIIGGTTQKAWVILGANSLKAIRPGPIKPGRLIHLQ